MHTCNNKGQLLEALTTSYAPKVWCSHFTDFPSQQWIQIYREDISAKLIHLSSMLILFVGHYLLYSDTFYIKFIKYIYRFQHQHKTSNILPCYHVLCATEAVMCRFNLRSTCQRSKRDQSYKQATYSVPCLCQQLIKMNLLVQY